MSSKNSIFGTKSKGSNYYSYFSYDQSSSNLNSVILVPPTCYSNLDYGISVEIYDENYYSPYWSNLVYAYLFLLYSSNLTFYN